jgi:hypothetical protein
LSALAAVTLGISAAAAQTYYGGYNLGPDYGAMINEMQQRQQLMNQQMQRTEMQVVQRTMQDPNCQAMYRQHRAGGGTLSFQQFAYRYAATGGFSQEGMRRYRQSESDNQMRERNAVAGLRNAEQQRGAAQQDWAAGYARNQAEAGLVTQGQSSWVDPATGQHRALSYMGPNTSYDPATGQQFARDAQGNQWALTPYGQWVPMTPAR